MPGEQFHTLNDLKSLVKRLIRAVTPEQCVQRDGGHIEQLL